MCVVSLSDTVRLNVATGNCYKTSLHTKGGTGMKIQIQAGYWVTNKFQVQVGSGTSPHKTLPRATCITCEVIHWHKSFEYVSITASNFSESFCIPSLWRDSNQSILSMRLASTTTDLIPYPFLSGVEEQIPVLPGGIQAPVSSLVHTMYQDWLRENVTPKSAKLCQVPGLIIHTYVSMGCSGLVLHTD